MAKVICGVTYGAEENEDGIEVGCTYASCSRCGKETMSWGTHERSVRRCLVLLREGCERDEKNFYTQDSDDYPIDDDEVITYV